MRTPITILFVLAGLACQPACTTVTPIVVSSQDASFDDGGQNSGVLAQVPEGIVVTARLRDRYNALVKVYGRDFLPELMPDAGLTRRSDGAWLFARQNFIQFLEMNAWYKSGFNSINQ